MSFVRKIEGDMEECQLVHHKSNSQLVCTKSDVLQMKT